MRREVKKPYIFGAVEGKVEKRSMNPTRYYYSKIEDGRWFQVEP